MLSSSKSSSVMLLNGECLIFCHKWIYLYWFKIWPSFWPLCMANLQFISQKLTVLGLLKLIFLLIKILNQICFLMICILASFCRLISFVLFLAIFLNCLSHSVGLIACSKVWVGLWKAHYLCSGFAPVQWLFFFPTWWASEVTFWQDSLRVYYNVFE